MKYLKSKKIPIEYILLFLIPFIIYIHHLSPGVYGVDSGDFLSAAISRGVPHPSGYPLYTIFGILFLKLPISASPAWKMGLISVFSSVFSILIFYKISIILSKNRIFSFIAALMLAFLHSFWLYAEVVEVFALNNLFILLIIYFTIAFHQKRERKNLYILSFLIGLSLTNNLVILLILPGILIFLLSNKKVIKEYRNLRILLHCFLLFLLGLTPYLYIPLAARNQPYINWGMAVNLENFIHLVTRQKYGWGVSAESSFNITDSMNVYLSYFKTFVSPLILASSVVGSIYLFFNKRKLALFIVVLFIFVGPFFVIYSRVPSSDFTRLGIVERFYLTSIIILMLFVAPAMDAVNSLFQKILKSESLKLIIHNLTIIAFAMIPISFFLLNYGRNDLSDNYYYDNLAYNIMEPIPENSYLLFSTDTFNFPSMYVRLAYDYRTDLNMPLENTSYKELVEASGVIEEDNIDEYLIENKNSLDAEMLKKGIVGLIKRGERIYSERNVHFVDEEIGEVRPIPYGLVFEIMRVEDVPDKETYIAEYLPAIDNAQPEGIVDNYQFDENLVMADLKLKYSGYYKKVGEFIINQYGDYDLGIEYLDKSLQYNIFF